MPSSDLTSYILLLGKIIHDKTLDKTQKINQILCLEIFKMDIAIISLIIGQEYTVLYSQPEDNGIELGTVFDLGMTYCNLTIKFPMPVAIANAGVSKYYRHPCREAFNLDAYIGTRLRYGTLNFSSSLPRVSFDHVEREFIRKMAKAIQNLLDD